MTNLNKMILDCKICNLEFKDQPSLIRHIKKNHTEFESYEKYIIYHFYNDNIPTCKCGCGTSMKFESHNNPKFYADFTKNHWPHKKHTEETKKQIKASLQKTMLDLYGVDNPMKLQKFIDKIADTKQEKYNDSAYNNPEKTKQTNLERHGVEYPQQNIEIKKKSKKTNFKKYNAPTFTATPEGKDQIKKTKKEKYGDENYINIKKIKQVKLEKYGYECEFENREWRNKHNSRDSKIQLKICNDLGIDKFEFKGYEFDGKFFKYLIEVDGKAYHAENLENLTLTTLQTIQNDYRKTILIDNSEFELIRIRAEDFKSMNHVTFEDVWINSYVQDFNFDYDTKFITKEQLLKLKDETKKKYWKVFLKFVRTFQTEFPEIKTYELLETVIKKINKYKYKPVENNTFNNNTSNLGVAYLKSNFSSYWKSSYKNNLSPVEAWKDDKIMEKIIKYRIGLNKNNETFDFSLHQLVRGLSALRHTVSFFKPVLAASIYNHFIGKNQTPIVFDPCCGFGGRMLGFKSLYPDGTYIGCESNLETFEELQELSKNFTNVYLYNCKLEDFDLSSLPANLDLTFTSIPYFDLETYSNPIEYENFNHWKETFLTKLNLCPKLLVNIPTSLREYFNMNASEYFIQTNTSHFNKNQNKKLEFILDLRNVEC